MRILKPDETTRLFSQVADMTDDKPIKLPLIALSREPEIEIQNTSKKPMTFDGKLLKASVNKTVQLDAIPIGLKYQLDIYTKSFVEGDEYLRNFIFNFTNYPKLEIEIPYNSKESDLEYTLTHIANVRLDTTVSDNSDIKEKLFSDQFTRWTLKLYIDDAYLFSVPIKDNVFIDWDGQDLID